MTENFKILAEFIKDMSSETPNVESYIFVKENITKYQFLRQGIIRFFSFVAASFSFDYLTFHVYLIFLLLTKAQ